MLLEESRFKDIFKPDNVRQYKKLYKLCSITKCEDQSTDAQKIFKDETKQIALLDDEGLHSRQFWAAILEIINQQEEEIICIINDIFNDTPHEHAHILNYVELLKKIVEWQMRTTPKQLRARKIELRNARFLITKTQEERQSIERDFNDEMSKHTEMTKKSQAEIHNLNQEIDVIRKTHREELDREMNYYKTTMRRLSDDNIEMTDNLANQLEAHEAMLEKLVQANCEQEKSLKDYCKKIEKKCLAARNDYDRDLRKLNELKETMEMQLYVTSEQYDILSKEFETQSTLYENLKAERELAVMQAFAEQLENLKKNRAARIIQRTWRIYHAKISFKKKKKGRKNK